MVIEALSLSRNSVAFVTSSISVKETKNNINKKKKQKQKKNNNINKKKKKKKKKQVELNLLAAKSGFVNLAPRLENRFLHAQLNSAEHENSNLY